MANFLACIFESALRAVSERFSRFGVHRVTNCIGTPEAGVKVMPRRTGRRGFVLASSREYCFKIVAKTSFISNWANA